MRTLLTRAVLAAALILSLAPAAAHAQVESTVQLGVSGIVLKTVNGVDRKVAADVSLVSRREVENGTGANQANAAYRAKRTVNASTNDDLDLSGTALQDPFGTNLAFTAIKAIFIRNLSTTQTLTVFGASSTFNPLAGTTPSIAVLPGQAIYLERFDATGWAVTASSADILRIANGSGSSCTYEILLLGEV